MPTSTYTPLANITLGSAAASVTFSSISGNYRDLILVYSGTTATASGSICFRINGDSGSNYNHVYMTGDGSSTYSASGASGSVGVLAGWRFAVTTGSQMQASLHLMDYSATDKHKTMLNRSDVAGQFTEASAIRWANTSAITSILVFNNGSSGTLGAGTMLTLYGIAS